MKSRNRFKVLNNYEFGTYSHYCLIWRHLAAAVVVKLGCAAVFFFIEQVKSVKI